MVDAGAPDNRSVTIFESALRVERGPAAVLLILLPLVCWMWIVVMARDMHGPNDRRQRLDDDRCAGTLRHLALLCGPCGPS